MADNLLNAADFVKINDVSIKEWGASDLFDDAPFLAQLPAIESSHGDLHKYLVEDTAPTVGFRAVNAGRDFSSSNDRLVTATLAILDASFAIDKAYADAYRKGGAEALIQREAIRHMKAAFASYEAQIFRGTTDGDATGFAGVNDINFTAAGKLGVSGGASSNATSCYLIRQGEGDVRLVLGNEANITVGETVVQAIEGSNSLKLPVYFTPISCYVGLEVGSNNSIARIYNLNGAAAGTSNVLTDTLLSRALELFPAARTPNRIVCHRRMRGALQRSRTTYSPTGMSAPLPSEYEGVQLMVSDGVKIGETVVS